MIVCCEHNQCPDRPRFLTRRYRTRPWVCPQCGRWWTASTRIGAGTATIITWTCSKEQEEL